MLLTPSIQQNIFAVVNQLLNENVEGRSVEIEARFGKFDETSFRSTVDPNVFSRVKEMAVKLSDYTYIHSKDRIYTQYKREDGVSERYTEIYNEEETPCEKFRLTKQKIDFFDIPEHFVRIAISVETIDDTNPPQDLEPNLVRDKKRWSFLIQNKYRLDLTEVTSYFPRDRDPLAAKTIYEIEMEIDSPEENKLSDLNEFDQVLQIFLQEYLGTTILYGQKELLDLIPRINRYLGSDIRNPYAIDYRILTQARNIKLRDLVTGGIVPKNNHGYYYSVTPKADGFRKLLVIDTNGIYLVSTPNVVNKIFDVDVVQSLKSWIGTVIEGELIPKDKIKDKHQSDFENINLYFLMYDVLSIAGDPSIRYQTHSTRLEYIEKFKDIFQFVKGIKFEKKEFHSFLRREDFYKKISNTLNEDWPFETDGLVITPENYQYDTNLYSTKIGERNLTQYPDILKWKPVDLLTIDFEINHVDDGENYYVELLSGVSRDFQRDGLAKKGLAKFRGDRNNPFDPKINVFRNNLLDRSPTGSILEFQWIPEDNEVDPPVPGKFKAIRRRTDKDRPNRMDVALDDWKDIHLPVDERVIRGEKFELMFRHHSQIKRNLFLGAGKGLPEVDGVNVKSRILLDIGTGRGGDINKWEAAGFTHVICVEPDQENRIELVKRLNGSKFKDTNLIIPTIGQDFNTIILQVWEFVKDISPDKKIDAISYMLSLSFFFDKPESTESIAIIAAYLLRSGGYFLAFTIDGRYVLEFFNNQALYLEKNGVKRARLTTIDFELRPPNQNYEYPHIYINIPDSIVQEYNESLTNLPDLFELLKTPNYFGKNSLIKIKEERANQKELSGEQLFMTDEELLINRLYTGFILKRE